LLLFLVEPEPGRASVFLMVIANEQLPRGAAIRHLIAPTALDGAINGTSIVVYTSLY
jgi:hypothetical protein